MMWWKISGPVLAVIAVGLVVQHESGSWLPWPHDIGTGGVVAVGTFVSALAALVIAIVNKSMLKEMKAGREQAVRPHLAISAPAHEYELNWHPKEPNRDLAIITRPKVPEGGSPPSSRLPYLEMVNIGAGPATNIRLTWEVLNPSIPKAIESSRALEEFQARIEGGFFILSSEGNTSATVCSECAEGKIDHCPPIANTNGFTRVEVPVEINTCVEIAFVAAAERETGRMIATGPAVGTAISQGDFATVFLLAPGIETVCAVILSLEYESVGGDKLSDRFVVGITGWTTLRGKELGGVSTVDLSRWESITGVLRYKVSRLDRR